MTHDTFFSISTKRLRLEKANTADTAFFLELLNTADWLKFIGDKKVRTKEDASNYITNTIVKSYQINGYGLYKMVHKNLDTPIGICGLVKRDYLEHPDIGFALLPLYKRKGFTFEAAKAVLRYSSKALKLTTVLGITSEENYRSQNLLHKLGFHKKAIIQPKDRALILYTINLS